MAVVTSHDVADQVARASKMFPWGVPKSPTMAAFSPLFGHQSIVVQNVSDEGVVAKAADCQ